MPPNPAPGVASRRRNALFTVDQNVRMMYVTFVAGPNFDCFYPACLRNRQAENEIPVGICPLRRKGQRLFCFENQVRSSELPALGEFRLRWLVRWIALHSPWSTHFWIRSICEAGSRISSANFNFCGAGSQGGIFRVRVTSAICRACFLTSS